jgi:hypothetical protein
MINYQELMKKAGVSLDHPGLDPAFVVKARAFEAKLSKGELTDEETATTDAELVELFSKHDIIDEDSEELTAAKHREALAEAKADIAETASVDALTVLLAKYKDLPEVLPLIEKKIKTIQDAKAKKDTDDLQAETQRKANELSATVEAGKKEIAEAKYEDLQKMGEKYNAYPELVKIIKDRHEAEKPGKDDEELKQKLLTKSEWNYAALRAMGIAPTGNNMTVAGVKLEKEYLLEVYSVRR